MPPEQALGIEHYHTSDGSRATSMTAQSGRNRDAASAAPIRVSRALGEAVRGYRPSGYQGRGGYAEERANAGPAPSR